MSLLASMPNDFKVEVRTTSGRGFAPEELAQQCVDRLIFVSEDAPAPIRDQAIAYKSRLKDVVQLYLKQAVLSDRTTVYNALTEAGHSELADLIRRL